MPLQLFLLFWKKAHRILVGNSNFPIFNNRKNILSDISNNTLNL
jgi:hypothetical protein